MWFLFILATLLIVGVVGYHYWKKKRARLSAEYDRLQYIETHDGLVVGTMKVESARPEIDEQVKKRDAEIIRL